MKPIAEMSDEELRIAFPVALQLLRSLVSASRVLSGGQTTEMDHFYFIRACEDAGRWLKEHDQTKAQRTKEGA